MKTQEQISRIVTAVNGESFTCMYCRKQTPIQQGVRRALNEFIDLFHCVDCIQVDDRELKGYVLRGLAHPEDPAVEDMISRVAVEVIEFIREKDKLN